MKKILMITALACMAWGTNFSHMSTEELMNMRGKVNVDERPAFQQEMQKRMQSMTPAQRQNYMNSGNGMGMGMNSGNGNGMGMNSGNGMGKNRMMNMPKFSEFDLNHNGYITKKEFTKARNLRMMKNSKQGRMMKNAGNAPSFRSIDTNHDGVITQREFKKHQYDRMWNN
ncbi:MAG: EF-hand domain-containing protein [Sulfurovaceae bacterium]|nr:EF-hand domain-containing protein [Sulfurovaceae bacterium]MDD5548587.1 EF-hand domain-containing protein [Sulfurovaceae bacterium]